MICPVCENRQDFGIECDVCGKDLGSLGELGPPPVAAVAVEGLELTVAPPVGDVPIERVGELEVTRQAAVSVAFERLAELDATASAKVGEIAIDKVELAEERAAPVGPRTQLPTQAICRYCRQPQPPNAGTVCAHCGMALPRARATTAAGSSPAVTVRCRACGAPATAGQRCGDCGQQTPPA